MSGVPRGRDRLSINSATIKRAGLEQTLEVVAASGVSSVGLWRDQVDAVGLPRAVELVKASGLRVSSLCRGGFLTGDGDGAAQEALDENARAIAEAATLGTTELVMVVGGLPAGSRDLVGARERVAERLAAIVPVARDHGVRLVLEALHPMYCADRAVLSTLSQALDLAGRFEPEVVGVVVDTFHQWWDPDLEQQVARAGREQRLAMYQVCDFNLPIAADALLSRGLMGDGVIDFATITRWVAEAGYVGDVEVEIFNARIWDTDPGAVVAAVRERYDDLVAPYVS